tara:strand:- start:13113 stop:13289 length:177 start_codon:yes stop_codon:yes gene_type:complete
MANGQEKGQQNFHAFQAWVATQSDDDFKQLAIKGKGKLSRVEISKAVGCGISALTQNP